MFSTVSSVNVEAVEDSHHGALGETRYKMLGSIRKLLGKSDPLGYNSFSTRVTGVTEGCCSQTAEDKQ